jgi:isoleucyl-tRNA synthetase
MNYQFSRVTEYVEGFLDQLSNVWIRANRLRFYGQEKTDEAAFYTLRMSLLGLCLVTAPIMPFATEHMWQKMIGGSFWRDTSVHLQLWPDKVVHGDPGLFQ